MCSPHLTKEGETSPEHSFCFSQVMLGHKHESLHDQQSPKIAFSHTWQFHCWVSKGRPGPTSLIATISASLPSLLIGKQLPDPGQVVSQGQTHLAQESSLAPS